MEGDVMRFKKLWDDTILNALRQKCRDKKRQAINDGHNQWFENNENDDDEDNRVEEDGEVTEEVEQQQQDVAEGVETVYENEAD